MSEKFQDEYKELREILKDENGNEELYNSILNNFGIDLSEMEENLFTKVNLEYTSEDNRELSYAYETDSGLDLYASEEVSLPSFGRSLVPTGIRFNIPPFYELQIRSKSGLAINQGLMVLNSPGTVDQGYTGEIKVIIFNVSDSPQTIKKGTKIAQAVLSECLPGKSVNLIKTDKIKTKDRNNNGFGSTGI